MRVYHIGRAAAFLVGQSRGEQELHDEPAGTEEEEVDPLHGGGGEAEADARDEEEGGGGDDGRPGGEIVYADERVGALADPADGGVGACGAEDTD